MNECMCHKIDYIFFQIIFNFIKRSRSTGFPKLKILRLNKSISIGTSMDRGAVKDLVVNTLRVKGKNEKGFGVYFISFYLELFILFQQSGWIIFGNYFIPRCC